MTDALADMLRELVTEAVRAELARQAPLGDAPDRLLSVDEAAELLHLARSTFYGLVMSGSVRSLKVGSRRLVPAAAVREFIEQAGRPVSDAHAVSVARQPGGLTAHGAGRVPKAAR